MRTLFNSLGIGAMIAASTMMISTPAAAHGRDRGGYYEQGYGDYYGNEGNYRNARAYEDYRGDRYYRGRKCSKGTGGLIIGAIAGGLLGREVVRRGGDRTAGAIIGAGTGALAGRALARADGRRC